MPYAIGKTTIGGALLGGKPARIPDPNRPMRGTYTPWTQQQVLQFVGTLTDGVRTSKALSFSVLCGENAPTVTGGFANWTVIPRAQRVGMTVLQGYDPVVMTVQVMFDAVVNPEQDIERDIQVLEWMAGRGKLFAADGNVGAPGQGDSPIVSVFSANHKGDQTALIPPNCHDIDWIVSGLDYDQGALRGIDGDRVRQAVTITLTQHVGSPGTSFDSSSTRARGKQALVGQFVYFKVTEARKTIKQITVFDAKNGTHAAAVAVLKANQGRKGIRVGRSVNDNLLLHNARGTLVRVPKELVGQS